MGNFSKHEAPPKTDQPVPMDRVNFIFYVGYQPDTSGMGCKKYFFRFFRPLVLCTVLSEHLFAD